MTKRAEDQTLCIRTNKVFKRILDQALELSPQIRCHQENSVPDLAQPEFAISSILLPEEEQAFLERLDSVGCTRYFLQDAWTWFWI